MARIDKFEENLKYEISIKSNWSCVAPCEGTNGRAETTRIIVMFRKWFENNPNKIK
jgi:hypothetical protein